MNNEQLDAARQSMINWLSHPRELGKAPAGIEYADSFEIEDMHYYIFKFRAEPSEKWLVGVAGGFEEDDLEPCGHTFSDMKEYDPATARAECTAIVERIMNYWKSQFGGN